MGLRADGTAALETALENAGESDAIDVPRIPWWIWAILTLPILGVVAWYGLVVTFLVPTSLRKSKTFLDRKLLPADCLRGDLPARRLATCTV
jgi:hypothetical protein